MLTDRRIAQAADIVVPITYSSRLEDGVVEPSRLSLLAFDAACFVAQDSNADLITIAGEQSYTSPITTTGEALRRYTPPSSPGVAVLSHSRNRLINTAYQAEALAKVFDDRHNVTLVGWGFHRERVLQNLGAQGLHNATYVCAESVIDRLWQTAGLWRGDNSKMLYQFSQRYGFTVEWPAIKERALADFARREQRTRLGQHLGKSGWAFKLASRIRGGGRYDDITDDGEAIMRSTS